MPRSGVGGLLRRAGLACLLALAGCAAPQTEALLTGERGALPERAQVASVPFYPQERYYCGPAALAMVLSWSGEPVTQHDLVAEVYTPGREGTLRSDVVAAARRQGRLAVPVDGLDSLLTELAAGHPAIVFQNLGLTFAPQWHFAVATGYDLKAGELILHSGEREDYRLDIATFERTWARGDHWALTVTQPARLPAAAGEDAVVRAAAGLERAGRPEAAASAYRASLQRWPESLPAHIGLGNARFALGDLGGAEQAFLNALELHPDSAAAWNNLAYVRHQRGKRDEAAAAARKAVALDDRPAYRETLREVSR